ncbi:MAG TPA: hypothetical protein VGC12_05085 [Methyloradius sp.]
MSYYYGNDHKRKLASLKFLATFFIAITIVSGGIYSSAAYSGDSDFINSSSKAYNISAGPLSTALSEYAAQTGVLLSI